MWHRSKALTYHRLMTSWYSVAARKFKTKLNRTAAKDKEKGVAASSGYGQNAMTTEEQAEDFKEFLARCKNRQETFRWHLKAEGIQDPRWSLSLWNKRMHPSRQSSSQSRHNIELEPSEIGYWILDTEWILNRYWMDTDGYWILNTGY